MIRVNYWVYNEQWELVEQFATRKQAEKKKFELEYVQSRDLVWIKYKVRIIENKD